MLTQRIVDLLRTEGPLSRAEVARRVGVSKPTASSVARALISADLVVENGQAAARGGRPGRLLHFNARAGYVIGLDIGGTTARAAIADLVGTALAVRSEPTCADDLEGLASQVLGLCRELTRAVGAGLERVRATVVGTPGVVELSASRLCYAHNLPALEREGSLAVLRARVGTPLAFFNDVNLAALGERWRGAAQGGGDFVFVSIGTGLGFGLVMSGEIYEGVSGRAGEFGYVPHLGLGRGTLEERLSGPGLAQRHRALGGSGRPQDAFDEAERGLGPGVVAVDEFLDDLAWCLTALATLLDPERIVLGGGLGVRCAPHLADLAARVSAASPIAPVLSISALKGDAGLYGAVAKALLESHVVTPWLEGGETSRIASGPGPSLASST